MTGHNNIIAGGDINLADGGSTAIMNKSVDGVTKSDLTSVLQSLKRILEDTSIQELDKKELGIQVTILDTQTKSSKPNSSIIQECMRTVRSILESMTGNAAYAVLAQISKFI